MKKIDDRLESLYVSACANPSDIHQHLPKLRELASQCETVTEFGTRYANGSSVAFLAAAPKKLVLWDVDPRAIMNAWNRLYGLRPPETRFELRVGSTLEISIEPTDLLFIDTLHTHAQLAAELKRHGDLALRYLAFHDTETFGETGEDGSKPGLRAAIGAFQKASAARWECIHDSRENNGLLVLERSSSPWGPSRVPSSWRG